jgi:hypothetical protein
MVEFATLMIPLSTLLLLVVLVLTVGMFEEARHY